MQVYVHYIHMYKQCPMLKKQYIGSYNVGTSLEKFRVIFHQEIK